MEAVRGEVELSGEVAEPYNHVGLDYVRLEGDGGHGDVGMPLCFWTLVRPWCCSCRVWKGGKVVRERKTEEKVLIQYVLRRMED